MAIEDDFEVQNDRDIRYIGAAHGAAGAGYYRVIEFYRFLMARHYRLESTGTDDVIDITIPRPATRSTDNIITLVNSFNIDDVAAEHLYDGSVTQAAGATIWDGFVVYCKRGADVQVIQNGAVVTNDFWNTTPNGSSFKGLNGNVANGISHRFLLKVRNGGADIDGRRLIAQTRDYGKSFSEFKVNGSERGNNTLALSYNDDLNNQTAVGTVAGWTNITNTQGYRLLDIDNSGATEPYYSEWDLDGRAMNDLYERAKWLTRTGTSSTIYGLNGEVFRGVTHDVPVDTPTGTFAAVEAVSWSGGTGQMLAINSPTAATRLWMQLLTGVAPTDNQVITGATSGATCAVNGAATEREPSFPFVGQSTGSSIIGAYGLGIEPFSLSARDKLFDLNNAQRTPPNYVTFTVNGLVSGEDMVEVGPANGGGDFFNQTQFTLAATYNGAAVTAIDMNEAIPSDTPASGFLRVQVSLARYRRIAYTSYSGNTFTIASTNFSADPAESGNGAYVVYISKMSTASSESFTTIYQADRQLFVHVLDGGVSPIEPIGALGTLTSAGGSVTIQRKADA